MSPYRKIYLRLATLLYLIEIKGGDEMTHHEEKKEEKEEVAKVEPIKPGDKRGGKKKSLLDTCQ